MSDAGRDDVKDWWTDWIEAVRNNEAALMHIDASEPCQVEVFWLEDKVEGQVSVIMHTRDREDKEILVHGPFEGDEFVDQVGEVAREDRWQERHPMGRSPPGKPFKTKADSLAGLIARFIEEIQNSIFNDLSTFPNHMLGGHRLWGSSFGQYNLGSVTDLDTDGSRSDEETTDSEEGEDTSEGDGQEEAGDTGQEGSDERESGAGGYIYPPVWIDHAPEKTFEEKVWDSDEFGYEVMLRKEFLDGEILAIQDGLILVKIENNEEIRDVLNTIFGVANFFRRRWRSLQGKELVSVSITMHGARTTSAQLATRRAQLLHSEELPRHVDRGAIASENLEHIIQVAEKVYKEDGLREKIVLHLQAQTHLYDYEHTASFLLNWNIIEQRIIDILDPHLRDEYDVNYDRRDNITDSRNWFISHLLEVAEITDAITEDEYSQLNDFRSKRNNIVHDMATASEEQAEKLNEIVSTFLERDIEKTLRDS